MVSSADAVCDPDTVVVHVHDANAASGAVVRALGFCATADAAMRTGRLQVVHGGAALARIRGDHRKVREGSERPDGQLHGQPAQQPKIVRKHTKTTNCCGEPVRKSDLREDNEAQAHAVHTAAARRDVHVTRRLGARREV